MHPIPSKSSTKTTPRTTSLQPQASLPTLNIQKMVQIPKNHFSFEIPQQMAAKAYPVAIGTRGTVGSLIMQEIDYFTQLELSRSSSTGEFSKPELQKAIKIPKRKKKSRSRLMPSICSMVDVVESNQSNTFTYKNLKADLKRCSVN